MLISAVAFVLATQASSVTEIPFRIGDDAIIVDVVLNGCKASLMFDTGFSGTVVASDNLAVGEATGTQTLTDFVGSFQAKTVKIKSLKIGEMSVEPGDKNITLQPMSHMSVSYGTHCDGILGLEAFKDKKFEINFEKKKFIVYPDTYDITTEKADGKSVFVTKLLRLGHGSLMMSVEPPSGEKLYMALDTGNAGYATTHKDALERVKIWPENKKADFMGQSVVASGPVDTFKLAFEKIKIFGMEVQNCVFSVIDLPASTADQDGTIGFGFLKNFNITIDASKRLVMFKNFTSKMTDVEHADIGIRAFEDPTTRRMKVYWVVPEGPAEKAGVKVGDDVLSVNGEDVSQIGFRRMESLLNGEKGTKVKLDLSRGGQLMRLVLERQILVNLVTAQ